MSIPSPTQHVNRDLLPDLTPLNLTHHETEALLTTLYEELERRVGAALSDGLTDSQFDEFAALIDGDVATASAWARRQGIDPFACPLFRSLTDQIDTPEAFGAALVEWAPSRWLEIHRPDYREVVSRCRGELQGEVAAMIEAVAR